MIGGNQAAAGDQFGDEEILLGVMEIGSLFGRSLQMVTVGRKDGSSGNSAVLSKVPEDKMTAVTPIRLASHGQKTLCGLDISFHV